MVGHVENLSRAQSLDRKLQMAGCKQLRGNSTIGLIFLSTACLQSLVSINPYLPNDMQTEKKCSCMAIRSIHFVIAPVKIYIKYLKNYYVNKLINIFKRFKKIFDKKNIYFFDKF